MDPKAPAPPPAQIGGTGPVSIPLAPPPKGTKVPPGPPPIPPPPSKIKRRPGKKAADAAETLGERY